MNLIISLSFLALSIVLTKAFCMAAQGTRLMDKPNERSMHSKPTIRGGGLVFISLSLLSLLLLCYISQTALMEQGALIVSVLLVASVSFMDDLFNLTARARFLVQCTSALILIHGYCPAVLNFAVFTVNQPLFIIPFLFITAVWAINHFNFMDGIDGFCAMQAIFIVAGYAILFNIENAQFYQLFCLILIACLGGFLVFNFPPARLFMGDVGSASLGLLTFALAVIAQQKYQIPIIYWFMLNGLFLFDATCTLIRRVLKKEKWSAPHRKHAYQRLRQSGNTVRTILLGQLIVNISFLLLVLSLNMHYIYAYYVIGLQFALIIVIYYLIEKIFPMFQSRFSP